MSDPRRAPNLGTGVAKTRRQGRSREGGVSDEVSMFLPQPHHTPADQRTAQQDQHSDVEIHEQRPARMLQTARLRTDGFVIRALNPLGWRA